MRLAVILVHYHTPELAAAAVEALRADLAGTALEVEWLLIDNGSDAAGRARLDSLPVERIDPGTNLGYAGGVNLGMARSTAELAVVMNPDVVVLPGCLPALLDELNAGAAVAGPRFYWDRGKRLVQPPAEVRTRSRELMGLLAGRSSRWAARARRRWRRHARRHWEARAPIPSHALSGSLVALRRSAWEAVGPFDEGFRLYFEETDWLLRARRLGLAGRYVPAAEAVHLYSQSAVREPRADGWFEESARRFRRRHYGPWFVGLLEGLDRRLPRGATPMSAEMRAEIPVEGLSLPAASSAYPLWIEVSPNAVGFPAAAEKLAGPPGRPWSLPAELAGRLPESGLTVQVSAADGGEAGRFAWRPAPPGIFTEERPDAVRIAYVLPRPELGGGNKVIFQHVRLLQENGDEVTVLCDGPKPDWIEIWAPYVDYSAAPPKLPEQDLVIATYWTTLAVARSFGLGPLAHFCQGYEGGLVHLRPVLAEIEAVYSWPLPTLTVAPHLGEFLRQRFGRESRVAPPPLDPLFRPAWRLGPRRRPWIAVPGIFEAEVKGIPTALAAVRRLREEGIACRLLRFSTLPLSERERALLVPDRYLCGVPPEVIARELRRCDLLFLPSGPEEGFGLPLLEAMASKVPAVASRIPSTIHIAEGAVPLVEAGGFAAAAREILASRGAWRRARERGYEASRRFLPEAVAPRLVESLRWARQSALEAPSPDPKASLAFSESQT